MGLVLKRPIIFANLAEHVLNHQHLGRAAELEGSELVGTLVAIELPDNFAMLGGATTIPRVLQAVIAWRKEQTGGSWAELAAAADELIAERCE